MRYSHREQKSKSPLGIILIFALIVAAATIPAIYLLSQQIDLASILASVQPEEPEEPVGPAFSPDSQRYFGLKNISCDTLSKDFLIATDDISQGRLKGLVESAEGEAFFAESIARSYDHNRTTKTYMRGDQMKRTIIEGGKELTTIWKGGRIYQCADGCTMDLLDENASEEYYKELYKIRRNCMHFMKTELPESVDPALLFVINRTGTLQMDSHRCENFLIHGNLSYIGSLNVTLEEDQEALLWALQHLDGPVQECLDESTGIIVLRYFTLDLTDSYNLDFEEDGHLKVDQATRLTYFTDEVPASFLELPD